MNEINPLTYRQLAALPTTADQNAKPVRFMVNKKSVDIRYGNLESGNQMVYWGKPIVWVEKIIEGLQKNNPQLKIKAVFWENQV